MGRISLPEAADLLSKLLVERVSLTAFFMSAKGTRLNIPGFVDAITTEHGLVVSVSGPPIDVRRGYINVRPFDQPCDFWYGETRELAEDLRRYLSEAVGESVLEMRFLTSGEKLALFFTL